MSKNNAFTLPAKCNKIETERLLEIYGGKRKSLQAFNSWLLKSLKKK